MRLQATSVGGNLVRRQRWNIPLVGPKDGINLRFTTPDTFLVAPYLIFCIYRNGVRLEIGAGNDYTIEESGGPGTGYDTVVLLAFPPRPWEKLTADYVANI